MELRHYSGGATIGRRALRSEDNRFLDRRGLQTELVKWTPEKSASAEPSTHHGIEAVHLYAFAPPGLPPDRRARSADGKGIVK